MEHASQFQLAARAQEASPCLTIADSNPFMRPHTMSWDRRRELGVLKAWWSTTTGLMFRPRSTLSTASNVASFRGSMLYAAIAVAVALVATSLHFVLVSPMDAAMWIAVTLVVGVPVVSIGLVVAAAIDHFILRLIGTEGTFAATYRGTALSLAPSLLVLIPGIGVVLAGIWMLVIRVIAYRILHDTSGGRAALGALLVPVSTTVLVVGTTAMRVYEELT